MAMHSNTKLPKAAQYVIDRVAPFWWRFFDGVALLSWRNMAMFILAAFLVAGMLELPALFFLLIFATPLIKILAGGKRRAELVAAQAQEATRIAGLERNLLEARIAALHAQVEPHFLFNTLALIGQLIETDPIKAAIVHQQLVVYLRASIPQMRADNMSSIEREFASCQAYLAIMKARMKERLTVEIDLPDHLKLVSIPAMMIQSLVENAIKHGLEPAIKGGNLSISARTADAGIIIEVRDTGMGFNPYSREGLGLSNIRERLRLIYGDAARYEVGVLPEGEGGTSLSLHIPNLRADACLDFQHR